MNSTHWPCFALLLVTPPVFAQSLVFPTNFARAEAPFSDAGTLTQGISIRLLHVLDNVPARTISGIAFRRDGLVSGSYPSGLLNVDVRVSKAATTPATVDATFANNHGTPSTLFRIGPMSWPATDDGAMPSPFAFELPFGSGSFVHDGMGPLCIDVRIHSITPIGVPLDVATFADPNPPTANKAWGMGCPADPSLPPILLTTGSSPNWSMPQQMLLQFNGAFMNDGFAELLIGNSTQSFGGVPLPFPLPGTSCTLYTNIVASATVIVRNGLFAQPFTMPVFRAFNGVSLFSQVVAPAAGANPLSIALSNVVQHNFVAPYGLPTASYVIGAPSTAISGTTRPDHSFVIELR